MAIETDFDLWKSGWVVEGKDEWELLPGAPPDAVKVFKQINSCCTEDDEIESWPDDLIIMVNKNKSISEKNEEEKTASKLFDFENKEENK